MGIFKTWSNQAFGSTPESVEKWFDDNFYSYNAATKIKTLNYKFISCNKLDPSDITQSFLYRVQGKLEDFSGECWCIIYSNK